MANNNNGDFVEFNYADLRLGYPEGGPLRNYRRGIIGKLVERLQQVDERKDNVHQVGQEKNDESKGEESGPAIGWLSLPDDVMASIGGRLIGDVSSFCSYRSVCKDWNVLAIYPDASLTTTRNTDSDRVPFCVMYTGLNQYASYNLSSHCWHDLPASFGSSFDLLGFNCNDDVTVVAGSGGFLVLESLEQGLWFVNPMNKYKRRLPPLLVSPINEEAGRGSRNFSLSSDIKQVLYFQWDVEAQSSSFKIFLLSYVNLNFEIQVYNSKSESWQIWFKWGKSYLHLYIMGCVISSIVEYYGAMYCLHNNGNRVGDSTYRLCIFTTDRSPTHDDFSHSDCIDVPSGLVMGQLFVRNDNLMIGGVVKFFRDGLGFRDFHTVCVWELVSGLDNPDEVVWDELETMPLELMDELEAILELSYISGSQCHVVVHGDYLWVTVPPQVVMDQSFPCRGIMCHLPSNSWWKLPEYKNGPGLRRITPCSNKHREANSPKYRPFSPFLFNPNMDLVV